MEKKFRLLLLLALLMTAATGAWADETPKVVFEEHFVSEPTDPTAVGFYEFINFEEGDDHEVDNGELSIFNSDGTLDINNWKRRAIKFRNLPLGEGKTYRLEFKLKGSTRFEDGINDGDDRPFCKASAQLLQGVEGHDISLLDSDGKEQRGEFENFDESNYKSYSMTFVFASEQKQKDTYALNNQGELAEKYYLSLSIFNPGYFYLKDVVLYEIPSASSGYTVSLKNGVKDADKWTVKVGDGEAQALPIGGLKGDGSETVKLKYTGRLKVKGVTATSDEKPAAPSVTEVTTFSELQAALSAGKDVKLMRDIECTAEINITSGALTIDGNGRLLIATSEIRAFKVGSSATVAFKNLALRGFVSGGGPAINNFGKIVLDGCMIGNCHVNNSNGGGAIENKGKLYAINTTFSNNYSGEIGGAINNYGGSLYMSGCKFINNYTTKSDAYYGGAIGINSGSEVRLINCDLFMNKYGTNAGPSDIGVFSKPTNYTIAGCTGATIASDDGDITTIASGTATLDYSDLSNISFTYNAE